MLRRTDPGDEDSVALSRKLSRAEEIMVAGDRLMGTVEL
jgi:hypothetical protein